VDTVQDFVEVRDGVVLGVWVGVGGGMGARGFVHGFFQAGKSAVEVLNVGEEGVGVVWFLVLPGED
jgi:hypothetical protein